MPANGERETMPNVPIYTDRRALETILRWCDRGGEEPEGYIIHEIENICRRQLGLEVKQIVCSNCGARQINAGQFVRDNRWVCSQNCRKELIEKDSYRDLAASGGIVNAP